MENIYKPYQLSSARANTLWACSGVVWISLWEVNRVDIQNASHEIARKE